MACDVKQLAAQAGMDVEFLKNTKQWVLIEAFADLMAKAERDRMIAKGWRQCAEGQSTTQYCGLLEGAVKAERDRLLGGTIHTGSEP